MFSFYEIVIMFYVYSVCGWCIEVAFVASTLKSVENRGFLNGPICPIYGLGMLGALMALRPIEHNIFLLFLGGMMISTVVELAAGWVLDKIFHMRWWDYTDNRFNIGGYVCLWFSIMWGMTVTFAIKVAHPFVLYAIRHIPYNMGIVFIVVISGVFATDLIVTLKNLVGIKRSLGQLDRLAFELQRLGNQIKDAVGKSALIVTEKTAESINFSETKDKFLADRRQELEQARDKILDNIQKYTQNFRNVLPKLNKSGKSINIKEYINLFRGK